MFEYIYQFFLFKWKMWDYITLLLAPESTPSWKINSNGPVDRVPNSWFNAQGRGRWKEDSCTWTVLTPTDCLK